jgi:membrane protein implicated in regulation of membrane protease activity
MAKDIEFPPLVHWKSLLKGVLGGSLFVGGLANNYGLVIQAILVIFGFIIILDGVMVTGKGVFIVICLLFAVIAGAVTLVLSATGFGTPYLIAVFIIAILVYMLMFLKPMRKSLKKEKPAQE